MYSLLSISAILLNLTMIAAAQAAGSTLDALQDLKKAGVTRCSEATEKTLTYLDEEHQSAYLTQWNETAANEHSTLLTLARTYDDTTAMATVTVTKVASGCDVTFTQIFSLSESCAKLRDTSFKDWKFYHQLAGAALYEEQTSRNLTVSLVPQPSGCMVTKMGILFFPDK